MSQTMSNFKAANSDGLQVLHLAANGLDNAATDALASLASQGRELVIFAAPAGQALDAAKVAQLAEPLKTNTAITQNYSNNLNTGQIIKSNF